MTVAVFVPHIVHALFHHVDPQPADLPIFRRKSHVRVGLCHWVVRYAIVDEGNLY